MAGKPQFDRKEICADWLSGMDVPDIARKHGASHGTIVRAVRAIIPAEARAPIIRRRRIAGWRLRSISIQAQKIERGDFVIERIGDELAATVRGVRFIFDITAEPLLRRFAWRMTTDYRLLRQITDDTGRVRNIYIYHDIMGVSPCRDQVIDHINRDTTDNRRINLRVCTYSENAFNRGPRLSHGRPNSTIREQEDA